MPPCRHAVWPCCPLQETPIMSLIRMTQRAATLAAICSIPAALIAQPGRSRTPAHGHPEPVAASRPGQEDLKPGKRR